jgi:hypothetical protein
MLSILCSIKELLLLKPRCFIKFYTIIMQTPVASIERSRGLSTWLWGMLFPRQQQFCLFFFGNSQSDESDNLE